MASNYPNDPVLSVDWRCTTWLRYGWKSHLKLKLRTKNNTAYLTSLSDCPAQLQRQLLNLGIFTGEIWALKSHSVGQKGKILEVTSFKIKELCKLLIKTFLPFWWSWYLALQKPLCPFSHPAAHALRLILALCLLVVGDTNTHGRYYAHTPQGTNANTCCCKCSCLFIAQTHPYFLETKIVMPHSATHAASGIASTAIIYPMDPKWCTEQQRMLHALQS